VRWGWGGVPRASSPQNPKPRLFEESVKKLRNNKIIKNLVISQ